MGLYRYTVIYNIVFCFSALALPASAQQNTKVKNGSRTEKCDFEKRGLFDRQHAGKSDIAKRDIDAPGGSLARMDKIKPAGLAAQPAFM